MKYGCFTTVRVESRADGGLGVRGWSRHVERLTRDATALYGVAPTAAAMAEALHEEIGRALGAGHALPRVVRIAAEPDAPTPAGLTTTSRDLAPTDHPLRLQVVRHDRMRPGMKHTLTAPEFAVRDAAVADGYDDAVLLTADGLLSEGTTWSLVLGRPDGTWVTPQASVLPSVTVSLVADRVPITAAPVRADALGEFDRAAALSSGRGVHPITSIGSFGFAGEVGVLQTAYAAVPLEPVDPPA